MSSCNSVSKTSTRFSWCQMLIRSLSAPSTSDLMMMSLDHQKRKFLATSSAAKKTIPSSSISISQKRLLFLYSIISILLIMASFILIGYESFQKNQLIINNSTINKILLYSQAVRSNIERYNESAQFGNISEAFNIVPAYKLVHCEIPDDEISKIMKNIFCYLYDSDEFTARNLTFLQTTTICPNLRIDSYNEMIKNIHFKYNVTVFVQNPFSRFLNSYLTNCVKKNDSSSNLCFGCKLGELECVVRNLKHSINNTNIYSDNLLSMAPLTWYCNMANIYKQAYFVNIPKSQKDRSAYLNEITDILLNSEVPESKVDFIRKSLEDSLSNEKMAEEDILRKEIIQNFKNNSLLLGDLMEIYAEDFKIFDISNPNLAIDDNF